MSKFFMAAFEILDCQLDSMFKEHNQKDERIDGLDVRPDRRGNTLLRWLTVRHGSTYSLGHATTFDSHRLTLYSIITDHQMEFLQ